ncbi:bifunctional diguanylate cyclase/phosphodiesterase [Herbaspirillum sp. RV1423]|uniref:putative bifunctional diguanylate cyclase/phosphodiesterase n=1 Tax=Herbaspirillum sp. RV1423 TaxID=1443993 RepID=UPI0004AFA750|nr:GGDEF domain-containing response regulator [Herbaspirillum sp. RV1423]
MIATMCLLLIDDDELDRTVVIRALEHSDLVFDIRQCATAAEGFKCLAKEHFDAVLLDYRLPDQDGIEVLHTLRSGAFENVAVVMLSRQDDPAIAESCLEAGAQDFLLKDEVNGRRLIRAICLARQRYSMEEALKASHEKLRVLSEHDILTGLINRRGFEVALNLSMDNAHREQRGLAVLLLDLDDFKSVNDTLGHSAGDELLIEIARRIRLIVRSGDFLCRLGGDEFVVIANRLERDEQASLLADRLISVLQDPIVLNSLELVITASVGIAVLGESTESASDLLKHADVAMYRAKQDGRNQYRFYSERLHAAVQHLTDLKRELHRALPNNEFVVYYQPQFSAVDESLCGMEALVRWRHPRMGLLTPGDFISVAEDTGLIVEIGNWVLQESCRQLSDWRGRFPLLKNTLTIAVNLSAVQLADKKLVDHVESALSQYQLPPQCLELEITESALIDDQRGAVTTLAELASRDVTLSLDDFGTGYSSMHHLKLFQIDVLKIDREFVSVVGSNTENDRLLVAMIRFAQALNLKIVAEGVESREQADFCRHHGCTVLQGYYYSKPLPPDELEATFLTGSDAHRESRLAC